jgi:hypothetical protein
MKNGLAILFFVVCLCAAGAYLRHNGYFIRRVSAPVAVQAAVPSSASLVASGDDHDAEEHAYQTDMAARAKALIDEAASGEALKVSADERKLPSPALPLVQDAIDAGSVSTGSAHLLAAALTSDGARVRGASRRRDLQRFYWSMLADSFESNAPPGAVWHEPARTAVEAYVRFMSDDPRVSGDEWMIIWREAYIAQKNGSKDPVVFLISAANLGERNTSDRKLTANLAQCAVYYIHQPHTHYPRLLKLYASLRAAEYAAAAGQTHSADERRNLQQWTDDCKTYVPKILAGPPMPRKALLNLFHALGNMSVAVYGDRRQATEPLFEALEKSKYDRSTIDTIKGGFNIDYAWDARGGGWGYTVTTTGMVLMRQRLDRARTALDEAWNLDPTNDLAATNMLSVCLGQGATRSDMEMWYQRAMDADPENYDACTAKLYYLEPKWYGSPEEMIAFGRQCAATGNWDSNIPMLLGKAYFDLSKYGSGDYDGMPKPDFFKANPAAAWQDLAPLFAEYFRRAPHSDVVRSQYALAAFWCGHPVEARQAFAQLNDHWDPSLFHDEAAFHKAIDQAKAQAATQPTTAQTSAKSESAN